AVLLRWMLNSLLVAFLVTGWHVFFDTLSGYAFAKRRFPLRNVFFWLILSTLMIPPQVTLIPLYIITRRLGLIDSIGALVLPGTAAVFGIFLMRQYIQTLPSELEDAARIDGCSEFGVFWNVILPLCKPAIAALAILWRQVREEHGEAIATTALIALNLFPTSFYFSALYTESLFLLLFALTYWLSRRHRFSGLRFASCWPRCCASTASCWASSPSSNCFSAQISKRLGAALSCGAP
ncbi:MAG: carbohydrate ABC transporter permease, partial [Anaerolineae bacterium]|nr:carbohydrate ABC transporter permease [Anaerolineae bacterium]